MHDGVRQALRERTRRFRPADGPLAIGTLMSPLRYDIVVRVEYLEFVRDNLSRAHDDVDGFLADSFAHPYYAWFEHVVGARLELGHTPPVLPRAFRRRVARTVRLYEDFMRGGFDARHPISVREFGPLTTTTGKRLAARYYPVDGCHRIALLVLEGMAEVPPQWYRIVDDIDHSPPDNTHVLLRHVPVELPAYLAFVARGYGVDDPIDERDLLRAMGERAPEVASVLEADLPLLTTRRAPDPNLRGRHP